MKVIVQKNELCGVDVRHSLNYSSSCVWYIFRWGLTPLLTASDLYAIVLCTVHVLLRHTTFTNSFVAYFYSTKDLLHWFDYGACDLYQHNGVTHKQK